MARAVMRPGLPRSCHECERERANREDTERCLHADGVCPFRAAHAENPDRLALYAFAVRCLGEFKTESKIGSATIVDRHYAPSVEQFNHEWRVARRRYGIPERAVHQAWDAVLAVNEGAEAAQTAGRDEVWERRRAERRAAGRGDSDDE